jgi:hypothetical protein
LEQTAVFKKRKKERKKIEPTESPRPTNHHKGRSATIIPAMIPRAFHRLITFFLMSGAAPLDIICNGRVLSVMRSISMRKKGKKEEAGEKVEHTC